MGETRRVAVLTASVVASFVIGGVVATSQNDLVVTAPQPTPTPTVTVTETASPVPIPTECVSYYEKAQLLPAAVGAYESQLGVTTAIQNTAVQGILLKSMKILNESRQGMIDLQNDTISSLEDLHRLQVDLTVAAKSCQEASTS